MKKYKLEIAGVVAGLVLAGFVLTSMSAEPEEFDCDRQVVRILLEDAAAALSMGGEVADLVRSFPINNGTFIYSEVDAEEIELLRPYLFDSPHCSE